MEKLYFSNHKGQRLCGYLHEPKGAANRTKTKEGVGKSKGSDKAIIMCHGFSGDKDTDGRFPAAAEEFARQGFGVLRFDFGGCGESYDAPILIKRQEEDLKAALGFMRSRGYRRFGLLGFSMGGLIALKGAVEPDVEALVLWAPLSRPNRIPREFRDDWVKILLLGSGKLEKPKRKWRKVMYVSKWLYIEKSFICQRRLVKGVRQPVLILHGDRDESVPLLSSEKLIRLLGKGSRLDVVKGANHRFDNELQRLVKKSAEWFSRRVQ